MKKIFAALFSILSLAAFCEDSVICTLDGRSLKVESLAALPDSSLEYTLPGSKVRTKIARGQYLYARIPKPAEIEKADAFTVNFKDVITGLMSVTEQHGIRL